MGKQRLSLVCVNLNGALEVWHDGNFQWEIEDGRGHKTIIFEDEALIRSKPEYWGREVVEEL